MKTKNNQIIFLITVTIFLVSQSFSQPGYVTLTFSGDNNGQPVSLESVWVKNLTQNCDTTVYPPDFTLAIDTIMTGFSGGQYLKKEFTVSQNFPNPFAHHTTILIHLPDNDDVEIIVNNLLGQQLIHYNAQLNSGMHTFKFFPSNERVFIMSVIYKDQKRSVQMLSSGNVVDKECRLKYLGSNGSGIIKSVQNKSYFDFNPGDKLLFVGHTTAEESGILDSPTENQDYVFQFATNIPCIGNPIVEYEGQTYNTVQIYGQCWLKENLNVGSMIPSSQAQTNNNIIEKYCMVDMASLCDLFGGLYSWNEMMKYTNETGGQGICPDGWHVPEDIEWQILEGSVDSENKIGNAIWGYNAWRGSDAGGNLKQTGTELWEYPNTGATNAYGFTALPGGYYVQGFWGPGYKTYFWSSHPTQKYYRNMDWDQAGIKRNTAGNIEVFSVRCVKD